MFCRPLEHESYTSNRSCSWWSHCRGGFVNDREPSTDGGSSRCIINALLKKAVDRVGPIPKFLPVGVSQRPVLVKIVNFAKFTTQILLYIFKTDVDIFNNECTIYNCKMAI